MKNKKIYIVSFLLTLVCSACNDWLDVDPKDRVREEKQYSNEDYINSALNGLYRQMAGENLYGGQLSQTSIEAMAHYYVYSSATANMPSDVILQFSNWNYTGDKAKSKLLNIWKSGYGTLLNINNYIKGVNESPAVLSKEHRNLLLGEAYGLRAYLHFDLFRLFGPYPYNANATDKVLPYNREADITLNHDGYEEDVYCTQGEYIGFLQKDLEEAERLLLDDPILDPASESVTNALQDGFYKNRNRRMNYYALKGLEARVLQYIGRDAEAAAVAKVITDRIEEDKVFHWAVKGNVVNENNYLFFSEVVFGINNPDFRTRSKNWYLGEVITNEIYVVNENNLKKNIFKEYSSDISVDQLANLDVRAKQWGFSNLLPLGNASALLFPSDATYVSSRYKVVANEDFSALNDFQPLLRVSEMYYIQAEEAMKQGNTTGAAGLVNKVLEKRVSSDQYYLSADATETEIREMLTREYYREFFGEGQAWFYHKRIQSPAMVNGSREGTVGVARANYTIPVPDEEKNI
ncbi:MAG: RagB/SusD family nutrient uptake outer membrane protein [Mediterranea sp.]|jgi:hypothetical protein|nr:RagB/SusD family nutrient uptake outer membrane protein [Mediterranea sp.]